MMCCHVPEAELTALDRLSLDGIIWVLGFWVLALEAIPGKVPVIIQGGPFSKPHNMSSIGYQLIT